MKYTEKDFTCTLCYDTGWYEGVSGDEKPCPNCKHLDYKKTKKYNYIAEYSDPEKGELVKEKFYDSLNNIYSILEQRGIFNYHIF